MSIVTVDFNRRALQRWADELNDIVQRRVVARALERVAAQTTHNTAATAPILPLLPDGHLAVRAGRRQPLTLFGIRFRRFLH